MPCYPDFLETFWLAKARAATGAGNDADALEKLRPAVQRLSDLFTVARPDGAFPDYAADPALLAAYGLFFFPQSFVRVRIALDQVLRFRGWRPPQNGACRILDLGSGTGPAGLAVATALREINPGTPLALTAFDHAPAALRVARELAERTAPPVIAVETRALDLRRAGRALAELPPQDVIVAAFAANELFGTNDDALRSWMETLARRLAPGGLLLVLEPALRDTATTLQRAADALANGPALFRWGPELGGHACPLLAEGKFWSHEVRRWTAPESLAFLNRQLFRDIYVLKFACTALGTAPPPPLPAAPTLLRLVSPLEPLKGRFVFTGVTAGGEKITVEIPARGLSKSEIKQHAAAWERGDVATVPVLQPLGQPGSFRLAAIADLAPAYRLRN